MASHVYSKDKVMEVQFAESVSPRSFFQKLANVGVTAAEHLAAVQPLPGNRYESIFKSVALCKQFHPQIRDLDGCTVTKFNDITVVTIHYISMSIPDSIVSNILSRYGKVHASRFTTYGDNPTVFDGTLQYKMSILVPIPTVIRIGDRNAWISYPGQVRTCARCNEQGHYAKDCTNVKCFKCLQLGHVANDCPNNVLCTICRGEGHSFRFCAMSFSMTVSPDKAWSMTPDPPQPPPDKEEGTPVAPGDGNVEQLPAAECSKCKKMVGPFHPSMNCDEDVLPGAGQ